MATYPTTPNISQGTAGTAVNPTNWNMLVDNINAIGADLVDSRGDGQTFPGTPYSPGQSSDLDDALQAIRHMVSQISGETNWYDQPTGSLVSHDHSAGEGGSVPWSSLGSGSRTLTLHPGYSGMVWTTSLRGAAASGDNLLDTSSDQEVVSDVAYNYYEATSSEVTRQDIYVAMCWTLPEDFSSWASDSAIGISYRTESGTYTNCHVDVYVYKSGTGSLVASDTDNTSTSWASITIDDSALGSWSDGDTLELFFKLETSNNYFSRVGKVTFSYDS